MERKDLITFTMSLDEALAIVEKDLLFQTDSQCESEYEFNSWANDIPAEFLGNPEAIRLTFRKKKKV